MKISGGIPNRARVFFEGNLPTGLDYLFNLDDVCSPRSAILTLTHKNNRRKDLARSRTKGHALTALARSDVV